MAESPYDVLEELNKTIEALRATVELESSAAYSAADSIRESMDRIYGQMDVFRQNMIKNEVRQMAHENILRIDQLQKEQFADHRNIRETLMGVVRDFDINLVRNSTLEEISEELWLSNSNYWLSYALLAITAWVNDFQSAAANAVAECVRLEPVRASLFFCLFNLRFGRTDSAGRWLAAYLNKLDPSCSPTETIVLLDAYIRGFFDQDPEMGHGNAPSHSSALETPPRCASAAERAAVERNAAHLSGAVGRFAHENSLREGQTYGVAEVFQNWVSVMSADAKTDEKLTQVYLEYIKMAPSSRVCGYEALAGHCQNYGEIVRIFQEVSRLDTLIERQAELVPADISPERQSSRLDMILFDLISKYDREEEKLKKQRHFFQLLLENDGDMEKAEQQFKTWQSKEGESFHIGKEMIRWALSDWQNPQERRKKWFGMLCTRQWYLSALEKWMSQLQEKKPIEFMLRIDGWTGTVTATGNSAHGSSSCEGQTPILDQAEQERNMQSYFQTSRIWLTAVNSVNLIVAVVFILSVGIAFLNPFVLAVSAVSFGILVLRIARAQKKYNGRVEHARKTLNQCVEELSDFLQYYEKNKGKKDVLEEMLHN
ncbi:MAG: hypothetical protein LUC98_01710 [Lachnospiraceae bacterium]|nr:hypothetical protein [Lachnospiraceae bacterium]